MSQFRPIPAAGKAALAPDVRLLDDRAARAWTERMAVRPLEGPRYAVDSQSGATYVVDLAAGSCTCPDHEIRGETCKHRRRVAIEITARRVPPPGRRRASCRCCGTRCFVPEQRELALCPACDLEAGDVVRDRESGDRLAVVEVTDRRADEVPVAAADCTVADYEGNEAYPADDPVVEARYLTDAARGADRTYSFPRSRLDPVDDAAVLDIG